MTIKIYSDNGNLIENKVYIGKKLSHKTLYEYDKDKNKISETYFNKGKVTGRFIFRYDKFQNIIEENYLDKNLELLWLNKITYFKNSNKLKEKRYFDKNNNLTLYLKLDIKGNLIKEENYSVE